MKPIYIAVLALVCLNTSAASLPAATPTVDLATIRLDCAAAEAGVALSKKALQDLDRQGWDTAKLCALAYKGDATVADLENEMAQSVPVTTGAAGGHNCVTTGSNSPIVVGENSAVVINGKIYAPGQSADCAPSSNNISTHGANSPIVTGAGSKVIIHTEQ